MKKSFSKKIASLLIIVGVSFAHAEDKPPEVSAEKSLQGTLFSEPEFSKMLAAYREILPGKRRALEFVLRETTAQLEVQDPAKPENVDAYDYENGKMQAPRPVKLQGRWITIREIKEKDALEANLFELSEVALERIPDLTKEALEKLNLEGGSIKWVAIKAFSMPRFDQAKGIMTIEKKSPTIRVSVEGARKSGKLTADIKGKVIDVKID